MGSVPKDLPHIKADGKRIINSDHILRLTEVPKSMLVIGAGAVGCEFASFLIDVGVDVTLIEMLPTVVPLEDADCGKALAKALSARGVNVLTSARVLADRTRIYDSTVEVTVEHENAEKQLTADIALVAVGREAVTDNLGLDKTAVQLDKGFIRVDETYRTEEPNIYAIGDAIGGLLLAHVAAAEGFIAAEAIAGKDAERLDYNRVPRVTYSYPQVASVGMTEQQARDADRNAKSQRFSFKYNAMALIQDETEGFAKIVYDAESGDLLGAHIIGHHACEMIAEAALARFVESSAWELGSNIHAHPKDRHLAMVTRRQFGYWLRDKIFEIDPSLRVDLGFSEGLLDSWAAREAFLMFCLLIDPDRPTWRAWLGYQDSDTGKDFTPPKRNADAYLRLLASASDKVTTDTIEALAAEPRSKSRGAGGTTIWDRAKRFVDLRPKFDWTSSRMKRMSCSRQNAWSIWR